MDNTLKALYDLGEKMQEALDADDLGAFYKLVDQRENIVKQLRPEKEKGLSPEDTATLETQFHAIMGALNSKEMQMIEQLQQLDKFRKADRSYNTSAQHRRFINDKLTG